MNGGKSAPYARSGRLVPFRTPGTVEKSDRSVTVADIRRNKNEVLETWTVAALTTLHQQQEYQTDPQAMLYARAASDVCRQIAADVPAAASGYSVEEMQLADEPALRPPPSSADRPRRRPRREGGPPDRRRGGAPQASPGASPRGGRATEGRRPSPGVTEDHRLPAAQVVRAVQG